MMKAVILAGGLGTRLAEETEIRPKPMVEIGGKPILWHIMKIYTHFGIHEFIVCLGHKGHMIKEFFFNYSLHASNITLDVINNHVKVHESFSEPWRITLVDTGERTMTGGRLKRISDHVGDEDFLMTYGDGVASIDINECIKFHYNHNLMATVTAVQPPGRFGVLDISQQSRVVGFHEKPSGDHSWINGGFFVLSPKVFDYIHGDTSVWETDVMNRLVEDGQINAYLHHGFWRPMDTLRDKHILQDLWDQGQAPWKLWS